MRPPVGGPAEPTTPPPTPSGTIEIALTNFELAYTVADTRMPDMNQYDELEAATQPFLDNYMMDRFSSQNEAVLLYFRPERVSGRWMIDSPIMVEWKASAFFDPSSTTTPSVETLDLVLSEAFEEEDSLDAYLKVLKRLPANNVFSTTTSLGSEPADSSTTRSTGGGSDGTSAAAIAAAGAAGLTVLAAGVILLKRHRSQDSSGPSFKKLGRGKRFRGDATVAGETYAGETYDGTVSVSAASRYSKDNGFVSVNLNEHNDDYDDSSVSPVWDNGSVAEKGEVDHAEENSSDDSADDSDDNSQDSDIQQSVDGQQQYDHEEGPMRQQDPAGDLLDDEAHYSSNLRSVSSDESAYEQASDSEDEGQGKEYPIDLVDRENAENDDDESVLTTDLDVSSQRPLTMETIEAMLENATESNTPYRD